VPAAIRLCGRMAVELGGREVALRGRQARLVVAYLAWHRDRPVSRDELIELLWPAGALAAYGERYTAARLMADALLRLDDPAAAEATAAELRAMGALASAAGLSLNPSIPAAPRPRGRSPQPIGRDPE
jgi:hypothetical protein